MKDAIEDVGEWEKIEREREDRKEGHKTKLENGRGRKKKASAASEYKEGAKTRVAEGIASATKSGEPIAIARGIWEKGIWRGEKRWRLERGYEPGSSFAEVYRNKNFEWWKESR